MAATWDETLPSLDADRLQLRQLFTNLLTNAVEALEGQGHVWIAGTYTPADRTSQPSEEPDYAGYLTVEVTDDGPGVPAEVTDQMFSPFFTTKPRGSGLGLAIVRKIVHAHDGRIDVGVRAGGGARFRVHLPVAERAVETPVTAG